MPKSEIKPTPARMVLYVTDGTEPKDSSHTEDPLPAIVVRSEETEINTYVHIHVFPIGPSTFYRADVRYSEEKEPGTWHWPPRV